MAALLLGTGTAKAEWDRLYHIPNAKSCLATSKGSLVATDYNDNYEGGIYVSRDKGETWTKADLRDYQYNHLFELQGCIFATGESCRIARSMDDGETWEMLNYTNAVKAYLEEKELAYAQCWAMAELGGKLYAADYCGGGVLVSEDYGETWKQTHRNSQKISVSGEKIIENYYALVAHGGKLWAFGVYAIHTYDPATDRWTTLTNKDSNFMGTVASYGDYLICGRGLDYKLDSYPFLEVTTDGTNWRSTQAPDDIESINVPALGVKNGVIFALQPNGKCYTSADMGKTWEFQTGLPQNTWPQCVTFDEEYAYSALYSPITTNTDSGIWRIPLEDVGAGIHGVEAEGQSINVTVTDDAISAPGADIKVFNAAGQDCGFAGSGEVRISGLQPGIYFYQAEAKAGRACGKFIKH